MPAKETNGTVLSDGVYEITFRGAIAFKVIWRGEELQMYWGSLLEARRHLWLLNNPGAADYISKAATGDSGKPLAARFQHLKYHYNFDKKHAGKRKKDAAA